MASSGGDDGGKDTRAADGRRDMRRVGPHADATLHADTIGDQRGGPRFLARVCTRWGLSGVFIIERDTGGYCRSNACTTGDGGGRVAAGLVESTAVAHTCAMCAALIINTRGGSDDLAFLLSVYMY